MEKKWKKFGKILNGYEGKYQISNLGNIKSLNYKNLKYEKIMKNFPSSNVYLRTCLCKNGYRKFYLIHRLVAETFIPNPNNLPEVNHKDGNKLNNCVKNLEWCTRLENVKHAFSNKLINIKKGKENKNSKTIYQIDKNTNEVLNIFYGSGEIKRNTKFQDASSILKCCKHVKNYNTAYGYKWEFRGGDKNE